MIAKEQLAAILRSYLGDPSLQIAEAAWAPLGHQIINPATGGLYRVSGTTEQGRAWSLVHKICQPAPGGPDLPANWNYSGREALAYQSPIPYRLPAGATAPRFAGVIPEGDARLHLFLEEIQGDPSPHTWRLAEDLTFAELLGQWAALPLREERQADYLCPAYLRGALQTGAFLMRLPALQGIWAKPHIAPYFAPLVPQIERLLAQSERLLQHLATLPQVLCHFDAHRANVMRRQRADGTTEFVLLDWSSVGIGAVGEEIGYQFSSNVLYNLIPAEQIHAYADGLIARYAQGLAVGGAGEASDPVLVRQGFTVSTVLRTFGLALPIILRSGADPSNQAAVAYAPVLGALVRSFIPYIEEALALVEP